IAICIMPSLTWRWTTVSRRGQVTPVKATSTSSCSLSSNIQRAILASSPLAPASDEPRPRRMTPVLIGSGMASCFISRSSWPCSTAKILRPMPRWRVTTNSTPGWRSRASSSACGSSILTWPAAFRMKGMAITFLAPLAARSRPSSSSSSACSMKQTSMRQSGCCSRHWAAKLMVSLLPSRPREPWPTRRMVVSLVIADLGGLAEAVRERGVVELGTDQVEPVGGAQGRAGDDHRLAGDLLGLALALDVLDRAAHALFLARPARLLHHQNRCVLAPASSQQRLLDLVQQRDREVDAERGLVCGKGFEFLARRH